MKDSEESKETNAEDQGTAMNCSVMPDKEGLGDESVRLTDDSKNSPYLPGVIQIQIHDRLRPELIRSAEGKAYGLKRSDRDRPLRHINRILHLKGLQKIEQTFQLIARQQADQYQKIAQQQGMTVPNLRSFFTLYFPEDIDVERLAQAISKLPIVVSAVPVPRTIPPHGNSEEPLLGDSDVAQTIGQGLETQWYIFRCGINKAWDHAPRGGEGVVIADVDWGYLTTHKDLKDRLDPDHRYNTSDGSPDVSKGGTNHGTQVMGLVGAARNGFGMVGVAYNAELWPIQVSDFPEDKPNMWQNAIVWVMTREVGLKRKVIMLEGQTLGKSNIESVTSIREAVKTAIGLGIVVCVPAGNGTKDAAVDDEGNAFQPSGSIVVGATCYREDDINESKGDSNHGESVTVWAPGDDSHDVTCSGEGDNCYTNNFGATSGATPKVAGTVALMLEVNPYIRHSDVRAILNGTGTNVIPAGRFLNSEAAVLAAQLAQAWGTCWQPLPKGKAIDIEFGSDSDSFWRVGLEDHLIYELKGNDWVVDNALCDGVPCSALKIAVEADGTLWHIGTADGKIYRKVGGVRQQVPGRALDIASGADGSVWHVGVNHSIYRWDGNKWETFNSPSPAIKIAVDPEGRPWYIAKDTHYIFKRARKTWQQVPGHAQDIAIGDDASVWHIGVDEPGEKGRMRRWNGCTWEPIDGSATVIAVAPNGLPFHINNVGEILART